ncbi:hypothetical protein ACF044_10680 [Microbacterium sp. NPDC016588]
MTRRALAAAFILLSVLITTSCTPSPEQRACEDSGGVWITETVGYYPLVISTGKTTTTTLVPITQDRCVQPLKEDQ